MTRLNPDHAQRDTILLDLSVDEFDNIVSDSLKMYRDGDVLALSTSPLAQSELIESVRLAGEQISSDSRGRLTQSLLRWAVERIRPAGEHDWLLSNWRSYNILQHFYIKGMRASELAENMAIAEQTLYQSRPQAISALSRLLREEMKQPRDARGRRNYALSDRYARHTNLEQQILRAISVFPHSIPTTLLHKLVGLLKGSDNSIASPLLGEIQESIHHLVTGNLLISNEEGSELVLQPNMRQFILTLLLPDERRRLHCAASKHYLEQKMHLDAAWQLRSANEHHGAAKIVIEHQRDILDSLQIEELTKLVAQFSEQELSADLWTRIKIVAGEIAEFNKDLDAAIDEYRYALAATDKKTKALAYYRRAKAFEYKNFDESLAHYDYAIRLMEELNSKSVHLEGSAESQELNSLLVRMYIDQSWIFLQQRPNLTKAERVLHKAQDSIDQGDRVTWSDLHNALGVFYLKRGDNQQTEEHYWQAWLAANETQDIERMTNTAHNLGYHLCVNGKPRQALEYLDTSRSLSIKTSNRKVEAFCDMSIGICFFFLKDFQQAVQHYRNAAKVATTIGDQFLLSRIYCNLAESHAELNDEEQMHRYFSEGLRLATELGDEGAQQEFATVLAAYPQLALSPQKIDLTSRQQQALDHVKQNGQITNREYQEVLEVSQKQAVRDLNDLVEKGVLARVGKGRATCYKLPTKEMALEHSV